VAVDDLGRAAHHRHVGQEAGHQAGAHGRAVDRRHDGLGAVDDVEHQVPRLAHDPQAAGVVVEDLVDQLEAAARREPLAGAAQQGHVRVGIAVDGLPHVGELAVGGEAHGVQPRRVERDAQDPGSGPVEGELVEGRVAVQPGGRGVGRGGRGHGCSWVQSASDW
jgi:hypothetical protein